MVCRIDFNFGRIPMQSEAMTHVDSGNETIGSDDSLTNDADSYNPIEVAKKTTRLIAAAVAKQQEVQNGPPKLAPLSGVLEKGKDVLKPIAFKPILTPGGKINHLSSTLTLPRSSSVQTQLADYRQYKLRKEPHLDNMSPVLLKRHYNSVEDVYKPSQIFVNGKRDSPHSDIIHLQHTPHFGPSKLGIPYPPHSRSGCMKFPLKSKMMERGYSDSGIHSSVKFGGSMNNMSRFGSINVGQLHSGDFGVNPYRSGSVTNSFDGSNFYADKYSAKNSSINGSFQQLSVTGEDMSDHNPSPSDSGVAEWETIVKEKDSEINFLRETMEHNEQVIFKVYEEKEKLWEREMRRIRATTDAKLKSCQQKSMKMEQMLGVQTYQLQQEKRKLKTELESLRKEKDELEKLTSHLKSELDNLKGQLEESQWDVCQKAGEISLLKTQLKDHQGDQTNRNQEYLSLKSQARELQSENDLKQKEISRLEKDVVVLKSQVNSLYSQLNKSFHNSQSQNREITSDKEIIKSKDESLDDLALQLEAYKLDLNQVKDQLNTQKQTFEEEKALWLEEKEKVIRYQKTLQLNYVQMYRRNRSLETEVENLALELERREIQKLNPVESRC